MNVFKYLKQYAWLIMIYTSFSIIFNAIEHNTVFLDILFAIICVLNALEYATSRKDEK